MRATRVRAFIWPASSHRRAWHGSMHRSCDARTCRRSSFKPRCPTTWRRVCMGRSTRRCGHDSRCFRWTAGPCSPLPRSSRVDFQLRTAVPLVDLFAHTWLDTCIARGELVWLVEVPERREPVLVRTLCPFSNVKELRAVLAQARTPSPEDLVINLADACGWLTQPDAVESCAPGVTVHHVHVAMVWRALAQPEMQAVVDAAVAVLPKLH